MKKIIIIIILAIVFIGFYNYRVKIKDLWVGVMKKELPEAMEYQGIDDDMTEDLRPKTKNQISPSAADSLAIGYEEDGFADSFNLDVPFTPQAPHAIWNETFKEGCEEAAALIVHYYYQNKEFTADIATDEILKMVGWQMDYFGGHFDLTAEQTAKMIKEYWNYERVDVINNPSIDDIKMHISEQRPVIVPAAGRELGNPYFRQPGPIYHMLVIKGYTETQFITNDPGTKRGKDFLYDYDVLMEAMHDWDEKDINQGDKKIIVIYPE